jgi:hypothetical protein
MKSVNFLATSSVTSLQQSSCISTWEVGRTLTRCLPAHENPYRNPGSTRCCGWSLAWAGSSVARATANPARKPSGKDSRKFIHLSRNPGFTKRDRNCAQTIAREGSCMRSRNYSREIFTVRSTSRSLLECDHRPRYHSSSPKSCTYSPGTKRSNL